MRKNRFVAILMLNLFTFSCVSGIAAEVQGDYSYDDSAAKRSLVSPTVRMVKWPVNNQSPLWPVTITKNTSQVLRFDRPVMRAAVSNSEIADITTVGEKDILINAKEAGAANLILWDRDDNIITFPIESLLEVDKLNKILATIDPQSQLEITSFNKTIAVSGTAETNLKLKQINEATAAFDEKAVSFVKLRESKQILLEVRFAEVDRKGDKEFKFDAEVLNSFLHVSALAGQTGASGEDRSEEPTFLSAPHGVTPKNIPPPGTENNSTLYLSYFSKGFGISNFLKWLEQRNILKIIARPNLMAKDGEEAKFIVGGEFPIPLSTDSGIEISYKEFGTQLTFMPEVLDDDVLRLKVKAEVSELDFTNALSSGGFTVPSIIKRSSETTAEMRDNQSLVIGGLITQKINKVSRKVPGLGDVPILGAPFKSNAYSRTDVELLIVITPHIVRPMNLFENKDFYQEKDVREAVRTFTPPYKDYQGDIINSLVNQEEVRRDFDKETEDAILFEKEVARQKAAELSAAKTALKKKEQDDLKAKRDAERARKNAERALKDAEKAKQAAAKKSSSTTPSSQAQSPAPTQQTPTVDDTLGNGNQGNFSSGYLS